MLYSICIDRHTYFLLYSKAKTEDEGTESSWIQKYTDEVAIASTLWNNSGIHQPLLEKFTEKARRKSFLKKNYLYLVVWGWIPYKWICVSRLMDCSTFVLLIF